LSKIESVRQQLADPTQALIPRKGGHGGFGQGLEVMKARNAGEAKWAKKQGSSHLDQRKRADFKARIGAVGNNQKRE
jgi:pre-60S factor REI1